MDKKEKHMLENIIILLIGGTLLYFSFSPSIFGLLLNIIGLALIALTTLDTWLTINNRDFPTFKKLRKNNEGIVYVWAVAAITIAFTALIWWVVSYGLYMVMDVIESSYTFPPEQQGIINLVKMVIAWFLAFEVLGVLIWALVSSFERERVQYPA